MTTAPHVMSCPHAETEAVKPRLLFNAGAETTMFECCDVCVPEMETLATETVRYGMGFSLADAIEYGLVQRLGVSQ